MRVLLTNDDGVHAPGMTVLSDIAHAISDDVWIVAPMHDQSGQSRAITLKDPLRLSEGTEIEPPNRITDQKITFWPALNFFAGGCFLPMIPPNCAIQTRSVREGRLCQTHIAKTPIRANMNAHATLL